MPQTAYTATNGILCQNRQKIRQVRKKIICSLSTIEIPRTFHLTSFITLTDSWNLFEFQLFLLLQDIVLLQSHFSRERCVLRQTHVPFSCKHFFPEKAESANISINLSHSLNSSVARRLTRGHCYIFFNFFLFLGSHSC